MNTLALEVETSTMNALSVDQMESISAGSCTGAVSGAATLVFAAALVSGPVGWGVMAAGAAAGLASGVNVGAQCA